MGFKEYLSENLVFLDGAMGTMLQSYGMKPGEKPEIWNLTHPDIISLVHKSYYNAGSNVVSTNTFGANALKFNDADLEKIIKSAVENAKKARCESDNNTPKFIALDIGPTGRLMAPFGDLEFDEAVAVFAKTVKLGVKYGVDLIIIETMNDAYETKAAVIAAKENSNLPILVSNAYSNGERLLTGETPAIMVALLEGLGVDAVGANCSFGPKQLLQIADQIAHKASIPTTLKPNAGLPQIVGGEIVYDVKADEFAQDTALMVKKGISAVGGCCGTTPEYIKRLIECTKGHKRCKNIQKQITVICSRTNAVEFDYNVVNMGEIKTPFCSQNIDSIINDALNLQDLQASIISINAKNCTDDIESLKNTVNEFQSMVDTPLMINFDSALVLENILRYYSGKAMVGKIASSQDALTMILPILKKYGGVAVIELENNINYLQLAQNTLNIAQKFGLCSKDIVFDIPLNQQRTTQLQQIKNKLNCHTMLEVEFI